MKGAGQKPRCRGEAVLATLDGVQAARLLAVGGGGRGEGARVRI